MSSSKHFKSLYSTTLGYYDFTGSPRVINPNVVGNSFGYITEMHEKLHRELAVSTSTGHAVQILVRAGNLIKTTVGIPLKEAAYEIMEHCRLPHESLATYSSLRAAANFISENSIKEHYNQLPQYYREAVSLLERIAGPITSPYKQSEVLDLVVFAITQFSLSGPCLEKLLDLSDLEAILNLIRENSPEERFRHLIDGIERKNLFEQLVHVAQKEFKTEDDFARAQLAVCNLLKINFPNMEFIDYVTLISGVGMLEDLVNRFLQENEIDIKVSSNNVENENRSEMSEIEVEVIPEYGNFPQDLSILWKYDTGDIDDLILLIEQTNNGFLFFAQFIPIDSDLINSDFFLLCYLMPENRQERPTKGNLNPVSVTLNLNQLRSIFLAPLDREKIAFKIDIRFVENYPILVSELISFSTHVFLLAYPNTQKSLLALADKELSRVSELSGNFFLVKSSNKGSGIHVAIMGNSQDLVKICSAISDIGMSKLYEKIDNLDRIHLYLEKNDIFLGKIKVTDGLIRSFLLSTYYYIE